MARIDRHGSCQWFILKTKKVLKKYYNFYQSTLFKTCSVGLLTPGGTCHVCIRGCACYVFRSEVSVESHIFGSNIANMNFPFLGGKNFQ